MSMSPLQSFRIRAAPAAGSVLGRHAGGTADHIDLREAARLMGLAAADAHSTKQRLPTGRDLRRQGSTASSGGAPSLGGDGIAAGADGAASCGSGDASGHVSVPMPAPSPITRERNSVMISYCRRNTDIVKRIHGAFADRGVDCWVDWLCIPKGVDWWQAIKAGIENANVCIFCLSNDSIKSKVCGWEVDHMMKHSKRVIPVVVADDFDWDDVRPDIARLNFTFFSRPGDVFERSFADLWEAANTDHAYLELHTRFSVWAVEWDTAGRDASLLFGGAYLSVVDGFLEQAATRDPPPSDVMEDFFAASHKKHLEDQRHKALLDAMLEDDELPPKDETRIHWLRRWLQHQLNRRTLQVVVFCLIVLDFCVGMGSLLVEAYVDNHATVDEVVGILRPISLSLLCVFELEILAQVFAFGLRTYCHQPGFVADFLVVTASLVLEAMHIQGVPQILTLLRAWRLTRLQKMAIVRLHKQVAVLEADAISRDAELRKFKRLVHSLRDADSELTERISHFRKRARVAEAALAAAGLSTQGDAKALLHQATVDEDSDEEDTAMLAREEAVYFAQVQEVGGQTADLLEDKMRHDMVDLAECDEEESDVDGEQDARG